MSAVVSLSGRHAGAAGMFVTVGCSARTAGPRAPVMSARACRPLSDSPIDGSPACRSPSEARIGSSRASRPLGENRRPQERLHVTTRRGAIGVSTVRWWRNGYCGRGVDRSGWVGRDRAAAWCDPRHIAVGWRWAEGALAACWRRWKDRFALVRVGWISDPRVRRVPWSGCARANGRVPAPDRTATRPMPNHRSSSARSAPAGPWVIDTRDLGRRPGNSRRYERTATFSHGIGFEPIVSVPQDRPVAFQVLAGVRRRRRARLRHRLRATWTASARAVSIR